MDVNEIKDRIRALDKEPRTPFRVFTDTTEFMDIDRDDVIHIADKDFLVTGNTYEGRFGIDEQPKFWVKKALDLDDGSKKIIKLVFTEEMTSSFGPFTFKSFRSGEKEGQVLELTRDNAQFMQGYTLLDSKYNQVRVIDYIQGRDLYRLLHSYDTMPHEKYFYEEFPVLLNKFAGAIQAIAFLHHNGICHGDIRTDHIFIDGETGEFRWIDFDLKQYVLDFDVWSTGNILMCLAGMGEVTFLDLRNGKYGDPADINIRDDDASAFFPYRIANLKKIFPYIPTQLNDILMKYSKRVCDGLNNYKSIDMVLDDIGALSLN